MSRTHLHIVAFCAVIISKANSAVPISKQHIVRLHLWAVGEPSKLEYSGPDLSRMCSVKSALIVLSSYARLRFLTALLYWLLVESRSLVILRLLMTLCKPKICCGFNELYEY